MLSSKSQRVPGHLPTWTAWPRCRLTWAEGETGGPSSLGSSKTMPNPSIWWVFTWTTPKRNNIINSCGEREPCRSIDVHAVVSCFIIPLRIVEDVHCSTWLAKLCSKSCGTPLACVKLKDCVIVLELNQVQVADQENSDQEYLRWGSHNKKKPKYRGILFPTCQVRVVRFYQSCSPPRLAVLLLVLVLLL